MMLGSENIGLVDQTVTSADQLFIRYCCGKRHMSQFFNILVISNSYRANIIIYMIWKSKYFFKF